MVLLALMRAPRMVRQRRRAMPGAMRSRQSLRPPACPSRLALLLLGLLLSLVQSVYAVDIYYARAIGQEYAPEAAPPRAPSQSGSELPTLGGRVEEESSRGEMGLWSKLLIGVALVAAVAALGDGDGGSAQVNLAPSAGPDSGPADVPAAPANGGDAAHGGGNDAPAGDPNSPRGNPAVSEVAGDPGTGKEPMDAVGPDGNGDAAPGQVPGGDNRGGFDIEVAEDRIRVDIGDDRFEFDRGNERGDDDRGRGRGRGHGDDD